jgi:hypothetical protein
MSNWKALIKRKAIKMGRNIKYWFYPNGKKLPKLCYLIEWLETDHGKSRSEDGSITFLGIKYLDEGGKVYKFTRSLLILTG